MGRSINAGHQKCIYFTSEVSETSISARKDLFQGVTANFEAGNPAFGEREMATHSSILAGESHGQRSLVGYSPWGRKESDMTERLHFHFRFQSCLRKEEFLLF